MDNMHFPRWVTGVVQVLFLGCLTPLLCLCEYLLALNQDFQENHKHLEREKAPLKKLLEWSTHLPPALSRSSMQLIARTFSRIVFAILVIVHFTSIWAASSFQGWWPWLSLTSGALILVLHLLVQNLVVDDAWQDRVIQDVNMYTANKNSRVYKPLDPTSDSIRVLLILPGKRNERLQCQLLTWDVEATEFDALSYCWGQHLLYRRSIQVNRRDFHITHSLHHALVNMRLEDEARPVWIDQICINQNDIAERNSQVQRHMPRVYQNARKVIVWLGLAPVRLPGAFNALRFVGSDFAQDKTTRKADYEEMQALDDICRRPYWSRSWVVQELWLADLEEVTIKAGSSEIPISTLLLALITLWETEQHRGLTGSMEFLMLILRKYLSDRRSEDSSLSLLKLATTFRSKKATDPRDKLYAFVGIAKRDTLIPVIDYHKETGEVYADFTARIIHNMGNLQPFAAVEGQSRQMACSWAIDWTEEPQKTMATSPLWGTLLGREDDETATDHEYSACGKRHVQLRRDENDWRSIHLKGWQVGVVAHVADVFPFDHLKIICSPVSRKALFEWEAFAKSHLDAGELDNVFLRTITAGRWSSDADSTDWKRMVYGGIEAFIGYTSARTAKLALAAHRPLTNWRSAASEEQRQVGRDIDNSAADIAAKVAKDIIGNFSLADMDVAMLEQPKTSQDWDAASQLEFVKLVPRCCANRRLFVTREGALGIGPASMSRGDHVYTLFGSGVPCVLRPCEEDGLKPDSDDNQHMPVGQSSKQWYSLLGTSYLDGAMHYDPLELDSDIEGGRVIVQDVELR